MIQLNIIEKPIDDQLQPWADHLARISRGTKSLTVGLMSGSRFSNDARAIFRMARAVQQGLTEQSLSRSLLLVRLDVHCPKIPLLGSPTTELENEPTIERSALGNWMSVEVPVQIGNVASPGLKQLPRWLAKWKQHYEVILVDLGPMHLVTSRLLGRFCEFNYVVLGPTSCASAQWILQHINHHEECGAHIAGSIIAAAA